MKVKYLTSAILIIVNLYPLYGIYFLGWQLKNLIILYSLETVIIFFYTLLKIRLLKNKKSFDEFFIMFFWISSGFSFLSFVLINSFYFSSLNDLLSSISITAIGLITASHGLSFVRNFIGKKEFKSIKYARVTGPYSFRALSVYVLALVGSNFLIFLILFKTLIDVLAHIYEHSEEDVG